MQPKLKKFPPRVGSESIYVTELPEYGDKDTLRFTQFMVNVANDYKMLDGDDYMRLRDLVNEFVMGPIYRSILFGDAKIGSIVYDDNIKLRIESLPNFTTLAKLTKSGDSTKLGANTKVLQNIAGIEKVFAACLLLAEGDLHANNIGVIETGGKQTLAKVNHGCSATLFFTKPDLMLERFANDYLRLGYQDKLPLKAAKLKGELAKMVRLSSSEMLAGYRIDKLSIAFDHEHLVDLDFPYFSDSIDTASDGNNLHCLDNENYGTLKESFFNHLKLQRLIAQQLCDRLDIIAKIEPPKEGDEREIWENGGWLKQIKGTDPIAWAVNNNKKIKDINPKNGEIEDNDPIAWAVKNYKTIKGEDPIAWASRSGLMIEEKDPIVWAVDNNREIEKWDPIVWAIEKRMGINKMDPIAWAAINNKKIKDINAKRGIEEKNPITWATEHNHMIEGKQPNVWWKEYREKMSSMAREPKKPILVARAPVVRNRNSPASRKKAHTHGQRRPLRPR